ncbi:MFS transporter [Populibacterium corticicola]|uniref:MFS transporter n=1 Tax=Populibacterium corticicola TaxID=1812826 RepID=A0ABW5XF29_9MICO
MSVKHVPSSTVRHTRSHEPSHTRIRVALSAAFMLTGLGMATWVSRTPAIRDALEASTAEMGLIIAGLSVGSMIGIAVGGVLVARRGARFVIAMGMLLLLTGLAVIATGTMLAEGWVVTGGLAFFGAGMGSGEIGQNIEAVELEVKVQRSIVPGLHGFYSLGVFVGGMIGLAANALVVPAPTHLAAMLLMGLAATLWLVRQLPADTGANVPSKSGAPIKSPRGWLDSRLLALVAIILGMALAEGSANDWLPLIVVDGFGQAATTGAVVYAFFGLTMAIGRFAGGAIIDRFGRAPVMRSSIITAAVGIIIVITAPNVLVGALGVLLWGVGASLGFPVALSSAGDDPVHAARRASLVATAGYAAFLIGPPVLGFLGEHFGIRNALLVVLAAVLTSLIFAGAVKPRVQQPRI